MTTVREATENAMRFARDSLGEERTVDMRLEEVGSETIRRTEYWLITLSMVNDSLQSLIRTSFGAVGNREYKIFTVQKESGEVTSMKIREFADA